MSKPLEILEKYWRYQSFRPLQEDIISSVLAKEDTLALMPTGGGKSICFQVPGMILSGVTIVITPLIALMKDQVKQLQDKGILAAAVYSGMLRKDIDRTLDNFVYGDYKFLYVSPERLLTDLMKVRTGLMNVGLLVVDEAHCISKWGHDFRPSYLKISEFRTFCGKAPMIALTATATAITQADMLKQLELNKPKVFKMSFKRNNLAIRCIKSNSKEKHLAELLSTGNGSSIVYAKTRKQTQEISRFLIKSGLTSDFYHAGLTNELRSKKQDAWINNKVQVMVSTNAFGMGIDKADVRKVFHLHIPQNIEAYYQEIGRAGRDGLYSSVFLLYDELDIEKLQEQLAYAYPPMDTLSKVYQSLCNYYKLAIGVFPNQSFEFDAYHFNSTFGLKTIPTYYAMKMLESLGLILLNEGYQAPSTFQFLISNRALLALQTQNEALERFTKTVLRIYGGEIFINPVKVSESEIAKAHNTSKLLVEKLLQRLVEREIGSYKKQANKTTLSFLEERYDAEKLPINHEIIRTRKELDEVAMHGIINYVKSDKRCRMAQLQDYFGEENAEVCGFCDHCEADKKYSVRIAEIEKLGLRIAKHFPKSLNELDVASEESKNLEEIIHHFVDSGQWRLKDGVLSLA